MGGEPRVAMVIFQFPPILGGAELQASRLAEALMRRGINTFVATARFRGLARFERRGNVPVYRLPGPADPARPSRFGNYLFMLSLAYFLYTHSREYDIVHIHQGLFAAALVVTVGHRLGKKTVVKFGGTGANSDLANLRLLRFGERMTRAIHQTDVAVATSRAIRSDLERDGFNSSQIVSIPNGIDVGAFSRPERKAVARAQLGIPSEARVVLYVGNLRPVKGLDVLLSAWQAVAQDRPDAHLAIVGEGPERSKLEQQVTQLGIRRSVTFAGAHADPRPFYWTADLFVLPSRTEGFPNVTLEALAAGLPCVASNVGGIPDQIEPGQNGLLVPPEEPTALADALAQMLGEDLTAWSCGARDSVRRFDWDVVAPQYIALYRRLLER